MTEPGTPEAQKPPGLLGPLGGIVGPVTGPFVRAGGYYARSWSAYLGGSHGELPVARPTLSLATHALRDELVLVGLLWRRPLSDPAAYEEINREVRDAVDLYTERGWLEKP